MMVTSLAKSLHQGALNVGDAGEIIAGLLLLLAADDTPEDKDDDGVKALHKGLASFLHTFVGLQPTSTPLLEKSRVHITHLGRLCTKSPCITQSHLQMAFLTGQAWYLSANFPGADLLVPVWQGPGRPMTALLVQVKCKDGPSMVTAHTQMQARAALVFGRKQIETLSDAQSVYSLFLNLRPLSPGPGLGTQAIELPPNAADGNLTVFMKMGFNSHAYPYLTPGECNVISGIVGAHPAGFLEENKHGLAIMIQTRDGSTFIDDAEGN